MATMKANSFEVLRTQRGDRVMSNGVMLLR